MKTFAVVDLFAGPGGLAEGFAQFKTKDGHRPFKIVLSIEKEETAHRTLLLRAFLRHFESRLPPEYYRFLNGEVAEPDWPVIYPEEWSAAQSEALRAELGSPSDAAAVETRLDSIRAQYGDRIVVIGGPPCQAYSLVGRSRNKGKDGYDPKTDKRHFLYQEYIGILTRLRPAAFLMENVKGLLSSKVEGDSIIAKVLADLRHAGGVEERYELIPLDPDAARRSQQKNGPRAQDFLVRAERFGIPQARHRLIVVGLRRELAKQASALRQRLPMKHVAREVTVREVLLGMPRLRSGVTDHEDTPEVWSALVATGASTARQGLVRAEKPLRHRLTAIAARAKASAVTSSAGLGRKSGQPVGIAKACPPGLREWLRDPRVTALPNSETRAHIAADLARYVFAAAYAQTKGESPSATDFPEALAPRHKNWDTGTFADRFRVQVWRRPATTITSHIAKDGHYFIHPDPSQCRSLTVREAARLQTFPDNYLFLGNRTEQYVQVGNAVPPFLARQMARTVFRLLAELDFRRTDPPRPKRSRPSASAG